MNMTKNTSIKSIYGRRIPLPAVLMVFFINKRPDLYGRPLYQGSTGNVLFILQRVVVPVSFVKKGPNP